MQLELPEISPEQRTPLVDSLLALSRQLRDRVAQLEEARQPLRDAKALLKGPKPRPTIRPRRLASPPPPPPGTAPPDPPKRPPKNLRRTIHDEVRLDPADRPAAAVVQG